MIDKLIRKWEPHKIQNLMKYIIILYGAGFVIGIINPNFYFEWLMLDIDKLLEGQVWRLVTFIIQPMDQSNFFLEVIMLFVYYSIGNAIERMKGAARFNLFYFNGIIINIIAQVIIYLVSHLMYGVGLPYPVSLSYFNMSMFLALSLMLPDMTILFMFIIPLKAKYLVIVYAVELALEIYMGFTSGAFFGICTIILIAAALVNMWIFYRPEGGLPFKKNKRAKKFENAFRYMPGGQFANNRNTGDNVRPFPGTTITRHRCAVCGRTELDGDNLEFRFCSKCNGNYEYCQDHINNHEHK